MVTFRRSKFNGFNGLRVGIPLCNTHNHLVFGVCANVSIPRRGGVWGWALVGVGATGVSLSGVVADRAGPAVLVGERETPSPTLGTEGEVEVGGGVGPGVDHRCGPFQRIGVFRAYVGGGAVSSRSS